MIDRRIPVDFDWQDLSCILEPKSCCWDFKIKCANILVLWEIIVIARVRSCTKDLAL
jgi:hypothetical protein